MIEQMQDHVIQMNVERIEQEPTLHQQLLTVSEEDKLEHTVQNIYHYQLYELDYGLKRLQEDILFYEKIIEKEMNQ